MEKTQDRTLPLRESLLSTLLEASLLLNDAVDLTYTLISNKNMMELSMKCCPDCFPGTIYLQLHRLSSIYGISSSSKCVWHSSIPRPQHSLRHLHWLLPHPPKEFRSLSSITS